jgi:hypothetical protein
MRFWDVRYYDFRKRLSAIFTILPMVKLLSHHAGCGWHPPMHELRTDKRFFAKKYGQSKGAWAPNLID